MAFCGFGETWRQAPVDDSGVTIIGINELYKYLGRWDEWMEIHDEASIGLTNRAEPGQVKAETDAHKAWLEQDHGNGKTIWMQDRFCDGRFPSAKPYPLHHILSRLRRYIPPGKPDYMTSTVAYGLGMLLTRGRDERLRVVDDNIAVEWIGLYGIELIGHREYGYQRPCAEWLVGLASGAGIRFHIPRESALLSSDHLYGFEKSPDEMAPVSQGRLEKRLRALRKERSDLIAIVKRHDGAILEVENWMTVIEGSRRGTQEVGAEFFGEPSTG